MDDAVLASMPGLRLLVGPTLEPAPAQVANDLRRVRVAEQAAGSRSRIRLRFAVGSRVAAWGEVLAAGAFDPGTRLVVATGRDDQPVLFDGIVTAQELILGGAGGEGALVLSGEDLTILMDLDEVVAQYPAEPAHLRAQIVISKYAVHGIQPNVTPAPILDAPTPADRIPTQAETDYQYLRRLALDVGYLFGLRPGPQVGASVASWGPPNRTGAPQAPLVVDGGAVRKVRFALDGLTRIGVTATILDPVTKVPIPIPAPDVHVVRPQLAERPAAVLRHLALHGMAKRTPIGAAASELGAEARTADPVQAVGILDVAAYGAPLRTGAPVEMQGAGAAYDGVYWVSEVTHRLDARGYLQRFLLRRDGLGGPSQGARDE